MKTATVAVLVAAILNTAFAAPPNYGDRPQDSVDTTGYQKSGAAPAPAPVQNGFPAIAVFPSGQFQPLVDILHLSPQNLGKLGEILNYFQNGRGKVPGDLTGVVTKLLGLGDDDAVRRVLETLLHICSKGDSGDGAKTPAGDGPKTPSGDDGSKTPTGDDGKKPTDDGSKTPTGDDGKKPTDDGSKTPDAPGGDSKTPTGDGSKTPDATGDGSKTPDTNGDGSKTPDATGDGSKTPDATGDGSKTPDTTGDGSKTPDATGDGSKTPDTTGDGSKPPTGDEPKTPTGDGSKAPDTTGGDSKPPTVDEPKTPTGDSKTPTGDDNKSPDLTRVGNASPPTQGLPPTLCSLLANTLHLPEDLVQKILLALGLGTSSSKGPLANLSNSLPADLLAPGGLLGPLKGGSGNAVKQASGLAGGLRPARRGMKDLSGGLTGVAGLPGGVIAIADAQGNVRPAKGLY